MSMFKMIPAIAISLLALNSHAKTDRDGTLKIYRSYEDYKGGVYLTNTDTTVHPSESKVHLPGNTSNYVWGVESNGNLYRIIGDKFYKVSDTSGLTIYVHSSTTEDLTYKMTWIPIPLGSLFPYGFPLNRFVLEDNNKKSYFFSRSLNDNNIQKLEAKELIETVDNPSFAIEVNKRFRWYKYDIYDYNKKKGQYEVNILYNKHVK